MDDLKCKLCKFIIKEHPNVLWNQKEFLKLLKKESQLAELEGRVGEVLPMIDNLQQYYYEEHGANSFNIVLDKIKEILEG